MAENENGAAAAQPGQAAQPTPPKMNVLAQFVRDISFENILAQKGVQGEVQPDVQVQVNLDAKKRSAENQYEVVIKLKIDSKSKSAGEQLFLLEMDYAGVFNIENVPEEQLHPYLLIECPRILFPFARRIVADATRDGGYPPLLLDMVDFAGIYTAEVKRRQEAAAAEKAEGVTEN